MTKHRFLSGPARPRLLAAAVAFLLALPALAPAQTLRAPSPTRLPGSSAVPGAGGQRQADYIVAVVNSEPITNHEVSARLARAEQQLSRQGTPPPRSELVREILERLILERAQLQLARSLGVRTDENAIEQAVASVARQNQVSVDELRRRLLTDGLEYSQFRADLRDELTLMRLRERELEPRARVSEQEIDQYLREQEGAVDASGAGAQELNIAQILVSVPETATAPQVSALQLRAQRALERARSGADFSALAVEFSDAPDSATGGQLGLRAAERYPPLFVDATRDLPIGGLAGPIRSGAGFHVLKLIDKKQAGLAGMALAQTRARHILLRPGPELSEEAAKDRLADFKRRIVAGRADFAALAREHSQDGSAKDGGDLGWASRGMFVPEFELVMNALAPGQIADPLVSRFGVHLIEVLERRQAPQSQREQREVVRNFLREKKMDEAYNLWVQDVRGRAYVEYRESPN